MKILDCELDIVSFIQTFATSGSIFAALLLLRSSSFIVRQCVRVPDFLSLFMHRWNSVQLKTSWYSCILPAFWLIPSKLIEPWRYLIYQCGVSLFRRYNDHYADANNWLQKPVYQQASLLDSVQKVKVWWFYHFVSVLYESIFRSSAFSVHNTYIENFHTWEKIPNLEKLPQHCSR